MNRVADNQKDLQIRDMAQDGRWVARDESGQVYFVRGPCIPGERVRARITAVRKSFIEADLIEILQPSPDRADPPCPYFGKCGGCQLQHIRYGGQLRIKQKMVGDALERLGKFPEPPVSEIIPAEDEYRGRNKIEFVFARKGGLAFHGTDGASLVPVERCLLIPDILNRLLDLTGRFFSSLSPRERDGCGLRRLTLRRSAMDGAVMVVVQMHRLQPAVLKDYVESVLRVSRPDWITVVADAEDGGCCVLHGSGLIVEKLGSYKFRMGPHAFFQTSTRQAEKLCETVVEMGRGGKQNRALDLFCGTGTIAHYLSAEYGGVTGIDGEKSAIENAVANARMNGRDNIRFETRALNRLAGISGAGRPDLVVMDPPRNGIHADALKDVLKLGASRIIYVSCNPATFARDARQICADSLCHLVRVQPIDMFPQTGHVETVSLFEKKN